MKVPRFIYISDIYSFIYVIALLCWHVILAAYRDDVIALSAQNSNNSKVHRQDRGALPVVRRRKMFTFAVIISEVGFLLFLSEKVQKDWVDGTSRKISITPENALALPPQIVLLSISAAYWYIRQFETSAFGCFHYTLTVSLFGFRLR